MEGGELESLIYLPILISPPMATYKEYLDGTYTLSDILDMVLLIRWKGDEIKKATKAEKAKNDKDK